MEWLFGIVGARGATHFSGVWSMLQYAAGLRSTNGIGHATYALSCQAVHAYSQKWHVIDEKRSRSTFAPFARAMMHEWSAVNLHMEL